MRVLIVNTSEQKGGAAIAASRLMHALRAEGVEARMLVRDTDHPSALVHRVHGHWKGRLRFLWERVVIWAANRFTRRNLFKVSIANTGFDITRLPEFQEADVVHLHWINQGFLSLRDLRKILLSGKRVVWTLHDMWPATAICHHAYACEAYHVACHDCPFLAAPGQSAS